MRSNDLRHSSEAALEVVLSNQFVDSKRLGVIVQCLEGSGIGAQLSDVLANLVFAIAVEEHTVLRKVVRDSQCILFH